MPCEIMAAARRATPCHAMHSWELREKDCTATFILQTQHSMARTEPSEGVHLLRGVRVGRASCRRLAAAAGDELLHVRCHDAAARAAACRLRNVHARLLRQLARIRACYNPPACSALQCYISYISYSRYYVPLLDSHRLHAGAAV